jgi:hypothetical protein
MSGAPTGKKAIIFVFVGTSLDQVHQHFKVEMLHWKDVAGTGAFLSYQASKANEEFFLYKIVATSLPVKFGIARQRQQSRLPRTFNSNPF